MHHRVMLPFGFSGAEQEFLRILACLVFQVDQFHQVLPFFFGRVIVYPGYHEIKILSVAA